MKKERAEQQRGGGRCARGAAGVGSLEQAVCANTAGGRVEEVPKENWDPPHAPAQSSLPPPVTLSQEPPLAAGYGVA